MQLFAGTNYTLTGEKPWHPAAFNHYGIPLAVSSVPQICNAYIAMYPGATKPEINDMSLPYGGKFDVDHDWSTSNANHGEHRVGRNVDFETVGIPTSRWEALNEIFFNNNVISVNNETAAGHWHLRFPTH